MKNFLHKASGFETHCCLFPSALSQARRFCAQRVHAHSIFDCSCIRKSRPRTYLRLARDQFWWFCTARVWTSDCSLCCCVLAPVEFRRNTRECWRCLPRNVRNSAGRRKSKKTDEQETWLAQLGLHCPQTSSKEIVGFESEVNFEWKFFR